MNFTNLLKVAITAIMSNKSRTLLSTLGIIIGVAAVITMMAIGEGSKESIRKDLSKMGVNLLTIRPGGEMRGGVRLDPSAMQTLKMADYEAIQQEAKLITHISPEVTAAGQVIYGAKNTNTTVYGESPEYLDIKLWDIKDGYCFTEEDVNKGAKVCIVGTTVVEELFGDKNFDAVGKTIRFKSIPFRIVGILKSKGYNSWGMDQDNVMIAPYTTVMKRIAAQTYFSSIVMSALSEDLSDAAIEEINGILRRNHKERTKEIGLRMSVGARGIDISRQFLLESIMISLSGGVIGVGLGYLLSGGANLIGFPATVPLWSVLVSFGVCALIGLMFGYIPAHKAATMDPIEALRYE